MKILFFITLFISSLFGLSVDMSSSTISNGRTILVEFDREKDTKYEYIQIDKKKYEVFPHPIDKKRVYALLPVSYYQKPSDKKVEVHYREQGAEKSKSIFVRIEDGKYKKETIKVQKSKVNLSKKDKKRAAKEYKEALDIYNTVTKKSYISSKFIMPLESKITSDFGKARVYNDTLKGYHSGTDFRAAVGTPLKACNDGVIVLAKDRFYAGGSVIIDHGHGIYTCYYHMSKFDVKEGQHVKKGELIGLSGDTGRVTGPHLHFSARVGGVQVDPLQLITLINKNLLKK